MAMELSMDSSREGELDLEECSNSNKAKRRKKKPISNQEEDKEKDANVIGRSKKRKKKEGTKTSLHSATTSPYYNKFDEAYERKTADNTWKPPQSEFGFLHNHAHDPWRVLVICMLLNRTAGTRVLYMLSKSQSFPVLLVVLFSSWNWYLWVCVNVLPLSWLLCEF